MLGTSKSEDQEDGFEIFITTTPIPDLNDKLNVFGLVIKDQDVVQVLSHSLSYLQRFLRLDYTLRIIWLKN